jgi:hypothetical protein
VDWQAPWSGETVRDAARASGNQELIIWLADRGQSRLIPVGLTG